MTESLYEVQKIMSKKLVRGKKYYYVKWKGYSSEWDTWEPEENFAQSKDLIEAFEESISKNKKSKKIDKKEPAHKRQWKKQKIRSMKNKNKSKLSRFEQKVASAKETAIKREKVNSNTIKGDFSFATPTRIISHIMLDAWDHNEGVLDRMSFEIEWKEPFTKDSKRILSSFQPIEKVKEKCPLLLCQYYEQFLEFK